MDMKYAALPVCQAPTKSQPMEKGCIDEAAAVHRFRSTASMGMPQIVMDSDQGGQGRNHSVEQSSTTQNRPYSAHPQTSFGSTSQSSVRQQQLSSLMRSRSEGRHNQHLGYEKLVLPNYIQGSLSAPYNFTLNRRESYGPLTELEAAQSAATIAAAKTGAGAGAFVYKVYYMLLHPSSQRFIAFSSAGTSFIVLDATAFAKNVLPNHFKHSNFSSFVRQLNMYGFHKVNKSQRGQQRTPSAQTWEFTHSKFVRGRPWQLEDIKRRSPDATTSSRDVSRSSSREYRFAEYNRGSRHSSSSTDEEQYSASTESFGHLAPPRLALLSKSQYSPHRISQVDTPSTGVPFSAYGSRTGTESAFPNPSPLSVQDSPERTTNPGPLQAQQAYYAFLQQSQIIPPSENASGRFVNELEPSQIDPYGAALNTSIPFGHSINQQQTQSASHLPHSFEAISGLDLLRDAYNTLQDEIETSRSRQFDLSQLVVELYEELCVSNGAQLNRSLLARVLSVRDEVITQRIHNVTYAAQSYRGFGETPSKDQPLIIQDPFRSSDGGSRHFSASATEESCELSNEDQSATISSSPVSRIMLHPQNSATLVAPCPVPRTSPSPSVYADDPSCPNLDRNECVERVAANLGSGCHLSAFRSMNEELGASEDGEGEDVFGDRENGYYERLGLQHPETISSYERNDVEMT